jgi:hypothetical protein
VKKLNSQLIVIACLAAVALLVGAVGYFAVIGPQQSKKQELAAEIMTAQAQLTAAQGLRARPVPFRASDLFRLAKAMPSKDDMSGILLDLRGVAKASSVDLTSVRPSPRIVLPLGYSALPLVVVVSGKYDAIASFLQRLRHDVRFDAGRLDVGGRLFLADQIALQGGDKDVLSATLNLDAFVYAAPAPLSATAGAPSSTGSTPPASGSAGAAGTSGSTS